MANKAFKIKHGLDVKDGALLVDPSNGNIITDASVSVGIGTSNITHTLTVNGDIHASGDITADGNITLGDADTDNVVFGADINSNLIPNTTDTFNLGSTTQQWNIGHFNSIAIDTAVDPTYKLTVGGSINITGNLYQNGVLFSGGGAGGGSSVWSINAQDEAFYTNGFVGIGTNNPTSQLEVVGDVKVSGKITSGGIEERLDDMLNSVDVTLMEYNNDGDLEWVTYATGHKANMLYDTNENLSTVRYYDTDGTTQIQTLTLSYNANDDLISTSWA